jgi:myotubularin-related protein 5/13
METNGNETLLNNTNQILNDTPHKINWNGMTSNEHQTYAGYLKKQGALFKQWKERYFVLDSVKHQVFIYFSMFLPFLFVFDYFCFPYL